MSYNWSEVFIGVDAARTVSTPEEATEGRRGWLRQLREGLTKSTKALQQQFAAILFDRFDDELWERIEEALIYADVGVDTTVSVVEQLEQAAEAG
ncbi:MAG: signal recognition particle receptor subunit alpha, partial [Thermoleophilia bacterium]|nr:signal recognition particle receptor subunit alpha [Thermoleophilia bacterium]